MCTCVQHSLFIDEPIDQQGTFYCFVLLLYLTLFIIRNTSRNACSPLLREWENV